MAYGSLREKIAAETAERNARYAIFRDIIREAEEAGHNAATACTPRPMIVGSPSTPFGSDIDPSKPVHYVADGMCGFAWVKVSPATSSFAKWAVKEAGFRKSYNGGIDRWVSAYNQSVARKEAYARAFAEVLNRYAHITKVKAYSQSRLD